MTMYYRLRIHCPDGTVAEKEYRDRETAENDWAAVTSNGINAVIEEFEETPQYELGSSMYGGCRQ